MTPAEAAQRRATLANRQGGQQERAADARRRAAEEHREEMPPPPPPTRRRRPRLPSSHQPPPGRQPPPSTHSRSRVYMPPPPPEQAQELESRRRGERSRSPGEHQRRPTVVGYLPAGYKSSPPASVSSLSEGGFSSDDRLLSDEIAEFAEGRSEYVFDDLHMPTFNVGTIQTTLNFESDVEGIDPSEIFGSIDDENLKRQIARDKPFSKASAAASRPPDDTLRSHEFGRNISVPAMTAEEPRHTPLFHTCKDVATSPRSRTPSPTRHDTSIQAKPEIKDVSCQMQPATCNVGVWTGEPPRPWLATPEVNLHKMAELQIMMGDTDQLCSVQQIADKVTANAQYLGTTTSQRRTIQLLVNYGFEVLRYAAGHLLTTTSNRYFHDRANISWEQTARHTLDTLSVWNRRPGMPQEPPFSEQEEELDWLM